jgi:DNA-binding transcriptional ArsR family regulator
MDMMAALMAFDALSQDSRLAAFRLLVEAGPAGLPAGLVAEQLESRQNTMSSHLKQLHQAGLVDAERDGRNIVYRANYQTVRDLIVFLMDDCCGGNSEVCAPFMSSAARSH